MYKQDRRMFERFAVDFPAEVKHLQGKRTSSAQSCNVSASGMGLLSQEKLIPEENLEICLGVPDGQPPFRGSVRVIWSKQVQEGKWQMGLKFKKVDFMSVRRIVISA